MRICRWCGLRIRWPWRHCAICRYSMMEIPGMLTSPPCPYMAYLPKAGEQ